MPTKVKVDRSLCTGCATCVAIAPKVFEIDGEAKSVIKRKDGSKTSDLTDLSNIDDSRENIINAKNSCPTGAIEVVEE